MRPIETAGKERVAERHGHGCWNAANGGDVRKIAGGGELGKRAEFGERLGAVGDAGVFVDVFVGSEEPEFAGLHRAAEGGDGVLAREGLLGIGFGIIERVPGVQILPAIVVGQAAMPVVSAAARGENDAAAVGARSIRAKLRGAHDKFLHGFGRKILEEAADVIVVVVAAVNGEVYVEARAAAERNGGDARLGGIGRLDGSGEGREEGNIGEGARGEGDFVEIGGGDDGFHSAAGGLDGLAGERWAAVVDSHGFLNGFGSEGDTESRLTADGNDDSSRCSFEAGGVRGNRISAGLKSVEAHFAARVGLGAAGDSEFILG